MFKTSVFAAFLTILQPAQHQQKQEEQPGR
jgi:hypothetical protein